MSMNDLLLITGIILILVPCIIIGLPIFIIYKFTKGTKTEKSKVLCPNCSMQLPNDTTYCSNCGQYIGKRN